MKLYGICHELEHMNSSTLSWLCGVRHVLEHIIIYTSSVWVYHEPDHIIIYTRNMLYRQYVEHISFVKKYVEYVSCFLCKEIFFGVKKYVEDVSCSNDNILCDSGHISCVNDSVLCK